jgi:hypothetical protein
VRHKRLREMSKEQMKKIMENILEGSESRRFLVIRKR